MLEDRARGAVASGILVLYARAVKGKIGYSFGGNLKPGRRVEDHSTISGVHLARIMHETRSRHRRYARATGQPSRGTAGLDLRRTWQYVASFPATSSGQAGQARPEDARLPARRAYSSERRTARSAVAAGVSCIVRARQSGTSLTLATIQLAGILRSKPLLRSLPLRLSAPFRLSIPFHPLST
jgi:hypothetical protein